MKLFLQAIKIFLIYLINSRKNILNRSKQSSRKLGRKCRYQLVQLCELEGLAVPKTTTNVLVSSASMNEAVVDYNAPYSNEYGDLAVCNDLTITGNKVGVRGHVEQQIGSSWEPVFKR